MHNAGSGARKHRKKSSRDEDVLTPAEAAALVRGQIMKRVVRAAAALNDIFDDAGLAAEVEVGRGAVAGWWSGAQPSAPTIFRIATATGLSPEELTRFVYFDGPPPVLPAPESPVAASVQEGLRRDQEHQQPGGHDTPSPSPKRRPRGTSAGLA